MGGEEAERKRKGGEGERPRVGEERKKKVKEGKKVHLKEYTLAVQKQWHFSFHIVNLTIYCFHSTIPKMRKQEIINSPWSCTCYIQNRRDKHVASHWQRSKRIWCTLGMQRRLTLPLVDSIVTIKCPDALGSKLHVLLPLSPPPLPSLIIIRANTLVSRLCV